MRRELFQTECDTFLCVVEIENYDIEFLIEVNDLFGMVHTAPTQIGDVNQTVYAAQIDEYTVRGDVFDRTFENLSFFEFGHDLFLLCLEFGLDQSLVRYDYVAELLIDLNHLEFHRFVNIDIVIADRFNIDLRSWQESLDTEHIDNHTALGTTFDVTLDHFVFFESLVHAIP